jgi:SH3-like domain-containing protein
MHPEVPSKGLEAGREPRAFIALAVAFCLAGTAAAAQMRTAEPIATATKAEPDTQSKTQLPSPAPGGSGQPLPRFVSLKSDRVNMRTGPGTEYPMQWVYRRAGLPMEVLREFEAWRQVRDSEGATGWVLASLLSSRRTALVEPWLVKADTPEPPQVPLKDDDRDNAANVAMVEAGVIANVKSCDGRWCAVTIGAFRGHLQQSRLWGVYKGETVR